METNSHPANQPKLRITKLLFRWLFIIVGTLAMFGVGYKLTLESVLHGKLNPSTRLEMIALPVGYVIALVFFITLVISILRRVSRRVLWLNRFWASLLTWRTARRLLAGLVILATLLAVFYAEENWRGKRAWEKCKRDLEAKGEVLDWSAYIPAPIPDEQNIFKAPKMVSWFIKPGPLGNLGAGWTNELSAKLSYQPLNDAAKRNDPKSPVLIARIMVAPSGAQVDGDGEVVRFDAPDAKEKLGAIVREVIGPSADGPQGLTFVLRQPSQIKPVRLLLETNKQLSFSEVSEFFPTNLVPHNVGDLRVEADAVPSSFRIVLATKPVILAEDYLAATDAATPELDLVREALKRPQIRMDGDFQRPYERSIVNFVFIRTFVQTLASRAQCGFLLGRPEQAMRELSLISESRRLMTAKPTMLVSAMIDVAICGLYVGTVADGFRLRAWREPDLIAIQKQLQAIDLPPEVAASFREERAAMCHNLQVMTADILADRLITSGGKPSFWRKVNDPVYQLVKFAPRGWVYQNLVTVTELEQATTIGSLNPNTQLIDPSEAMRAHKELEKNLAHRWWSPFKVLARIAIPNTSRALTTAARNQTFVNQAYIVCGLERYHRAHGEYPETLDVLVPQFIEKLPRDIIGGRPLHYRRTADGKFLLYSVGWNETDDGGQLDKAKNGDPGYMTGDWVWELASK